MDEVIAFKPLSQQTLEGIAALMLDEYKPSMEAKGIAYSYTPAALSALVARSQAAVAPATCAASSARLWRTPPPSASSTAP